jgi:hypothetical protein
MLSPCKNTAKKLSARTAMSMAVFCLAGNRTCDHSAEVFHV